MARRLISGLGPYLALVLTVVRAQVRAPVRYSSVRNPPIAPQNIDSLAGQRAAVDPRFPVKQASYKLRSEGSCGDVDPSCWEKLSQASIYVPRSKEEEPLFSRKPGLSCEECLKFCINATDAEGNPCRAAIYDHRSKVCDLFNVDGQTPTHAYHIARHPGRDYFRPQRNLVCEESGFDTRKRVSSEEKIIDPNSVEQIDPTSVVNPPAAEKKGEKEVELKLSNPLGLSSSFGQGGHLGGPLPADLPLLPIGGPVSFLEPIGFAPGVLPASGFGPPGVNPFAFQGPVDPLLLQSQSLPLPPLQSFPLPPQPQPLPVEPSSPLKASSGVISDPGPPGIKPDPSPSEGTESKVVIAGAEAPSESSQPAVDKTQSAYGAQSANKLSDKRQCNYDANCWEQRAGCSVNNGFLFRRITGVKCGECVKVCNDHFEQKGEYICKAVRYDHPFRTCDLFSDAKVELGAPNSLVFPDVAGRRTAEGASEATCYRRIAGAKCGPDGSFVPPRFSSAAKLSQNGDVCPPGGDGAQQVPRFLMYKNKDLEADSYSVLSTEDVTPDKCVEACNSKSATDKCRSFDFHNDFGCELNLDRKGDKAKLLDKEGATYYEKTCLSESALATESSWIVYPQKLLLGFARAVVDAPTLRECQISCLEAPRNFGFKCKSLMYYKEDGLNCIMNSDTRFTKPDNFIDEGVADMVYIDVPHIDDSEPLPQRQQHVDNIVDEVDFDKEGWSPWSPCEDGFRVRFKKCDDSKRENCPREFLACPHLEFLPSGFSAWSSCEDGFMTRYQDCDRENKFDCPREHVICAEESIDYTQ